MHLFVDDMMIVMCFFVDKRLCGLFVCLFVVVVLHMNERLFVLAVGKVLFVVYLLGGRFVCNVLIHGLDMYLFAHVNSRCRHRGRADFPFCPKKVG